MLNLVRNEKRVRRFVQEARAASALSHPHIVTIYEIGQGEVHSVDSDVHLGAAGGAATAGPIHFIAMELVSGETIGHKIHHEKTDLRTLLEYLAQAADGLALKAHAGGHRAPGSQARKHHGHEGWVREGARTSVSPRSPSGKRRAAT